MFDLPLHPIAVHLPIALGILIPLIAIIVLWGIYSKKLPQFSWLLVTLLSAIYLGSALIASQLGERDEDRVEKIVEKKLVEDHEEAGEQVPWAAGVVLLASVLPLLVNKKTKFQIATIVVSVGALVPLINAGHTGGKLVYKYGAANAYIENNTQINKSDEGH